MEIKTKNSFSDLVKELTMEIVEEEDLEEATSTGDIEGYQTPFAFQGKHSAKGKKKNKEISTNSTGYKVLDEDVYTGSLTELLFEKKNKKEKHKPGDVWRRKGGEWAGMNSKGV